MCAELRRSSGTHTYNTHVERTAYTIGGGLVFRLHGVNRPYTPAMILVAMSGVSRPSATPATVAVLRLLRNVDMRLAVAFRASPWPMKRTMRSVGDAA